jgi:outer membrane protein assembly factor BamA
MKFFVEHHRSFDTISQGFIAYGGDIRQYIQIHKNLILATRLSGASSFGTHQIAYYLGGTSNWLFPKTDANTGISSTANYIYQTLATPMRGFNQNVRNGNSYVLLNAELRWPIVSYFAKHTVRNQFMKNLMITGFFDAGSAWQGLSPYSSDNPYNTTSINHNPVYVNVQYYRQPIVAGFGYGLRSTMLGYYIRLDVGWGVDNGEITPSSTTYISLGTDF